MIFSIENGWSSLAADEIDTIEEALAAEEEAAAHVYVSTGLKAGTDLILWRLSQEPEELQRRHLQLLARTHNRLREVAMYTGASMRSTYTGEEGEFNYLTDHTKRGKYLSVYPFTKTPEWYLIDQTERRRIMGEHISIGRKFPGVRQTLLYSFGADDQEFIVAYEMDDLRYYIQCVMALRESESRKYTLRDTPVYTGIRSRALELGNIVGVR
ncbi:MAG: chlorite dismutase family protein [Methanomassiliicoccales archaeon]